MNESLSSGSNPPPPPYFSPFSLTAAFCDYFSSYFAPSPLALPFSHTCFSVFFCHLPLFSLPLWKVLSKSTLCTKAVWWHKLAAGQELCSLTLSPSLWAAAITQSHPPPPLSTSLFCFSTSTFFPLQDLERSRSNVPFQTQWGDWGAVGLSAFERGVSGNPLELNLHRMNKIYSIWLST